MFGFSVLMESTYWLGVRMIWCKFGAWKTGK